MLTDVETDFQWIAEQLHNVLAENSGPPEA